MNEIHYHRPAMRAESFTIYVDLGTHCRPMMMETIILSNAHASTVHTVCTYTAISDVDRNYLQN